MSVFRILFCLFSDKPILDGLLCMFSSWLGCLLSVIYYGCSLLPRLFLAVQYVCSQLLRRSAVLCVYSRLLLLCLLSAVVLLPCSQLLCLFSAVYYVCSQMVYVLSGLFSPVLRYASSRWSIVSALSKHVCFHRSIVSIFGRCVCSQLLCLFFVIFCVCSQQYIIYALGCCVWSQLLAVYSQLSVDWA